MNNQRIVRLPDPNPQNQIESEAVNLGTLNTKIRSEIEINTQLESL